MEAATVAKGLAGHGLSVSILSSLRATIGEGEKWGPLMAWWLPHPLFTDLAGKIFLLQTI